MEQKPPALLIFSQAFQACILPAVVVPIMVLINSCRVMEEMRPGARINAGLLAVLLFAIFTTYLAFAGLFS